MYVCFNSSNTPGSCSFIRLVDYLVASTFHQMVVKAVAHVLSVLQQRLGQSPVQSCSQHDHSDEEVSRSVGHNNWTSPWTAHGRRQFEWLFILAWCFALLKVHRSRNLLWSIAVHHGAHFGHKSIDLRPLWGPISGQFSNCLLLGLGIFKCFHIARVWSIGNPPRRVFQRSSAR